MTWFLPVIAAWALLAVPGYLMLCALGARPRLRWGWAPVVTVLITVVLTGVYSLLGIPWQLGSASLGAVLLAGLAFGLRLLFERRPARRPDARRQDARRDARRGAGEDTGEDTGGTAREAAQPGVQNSPQRTWPVPVSVLITTFCLLCGLLVAATSSLRMGGLSTLNGSYDSFFHLSSIAYVRADGDAFLTTALEKVYGAPTFYPMVFDALASLLPLGTIASANAMMLALLAALPSSVGAMVAAIAPARRDLAVMSALAAAASTLFLSTASMALVMGLWPIVLGTVCLPLGIAATVQLLDRRHGAPTVRQTLGSLAVLLGTALAHPSVMFSVAVVAGLLVLVSGVRRFQDGQRRRGAAQVAAASLAALLFVGVSGSLLSGMHLTKTSSEGLGSVLWEILVDSPRIPAIAAPLWPLAAVWVLAVLGAAAAVRRGEVLGITAAVGVLGAVVLGVSTQIDHPLTIALVNPWYGARERIAPLMMCLLLLLMVRGIRALSDLAGEGRRALLAPLAIVLVLVTVVAGVLSPQRLPRLGSLAYTAYGVQLSPYVTPEERAFIERTAAELPEDAVILADPLDGATLYWSVGGIEVVYPTMSRPLTRDTTLLANYAAVPDDGGEACAASARIGPTHLYRDSSAYSGRELNPEASARWDGIHDIPASRLSLVASDGPYALYELEPVC